MPPPGVASIRPRPREPASYPPQDRKEETNTEAGAKQDERTEPETHDETEALRTEQQNPGNEKPQALCRRDQVWDRHGRRTHLVRSSQRGKNPTQKYSKYVLLIRRVFSAQGNYVNTEIDVKGSFLQDVLREIHKDTKGISLHESTPTVSPEFLYLSWPYLEERAKDDDATTTQDEGLGFEVNAALQFIREEFTSFDFDLNAMLSKHEITWEKIWAIMPPSNLIFTIDEMHEPRIYKTKTCRKIRLENGAYAWNVECEGFDFDGRKLGTIRSSIKIPEFEGATHVDELPVFPFQFHKDYRALRESLLERAEKAISLYQSHHILREYSGHGLKPDRENNLQRFNSHGRIMIDPAVYDRLDPRKSLVPWISGSILPNQLSEDQKLTVSSMVYGFSFGDKIWGAFAVSRTRDVVWNDAMYKALVMPDIQKQLIFQLVKAHGKTKTGFDDFVHDKGKGLIGLLMGPPGLGKSLTAEAISETARKPLYMMTSGELGQDAGSIGENLASILELTTTWNAVLLIDEADVFMTKRTDSNLEQNAITSVFLRHLEYYPGILILTTNRAKSFDPAFQSRIHFCHRYEVLDAHARKSIWRNFIEKARTDEKLEVHCDEEALERLSRLNFNGRQIKNSMSISITIAMVQEKPLTAEAIIQASESLQNFDLGGGSDDLLSLSRRSTELNAVDPVSQGPRSISQRADLDLLG